MTAAELRKRARESLKGNWKQMILIHLIYFWLVFCCALTSTCYGLGSILYIVLASPFILGLHMCLLKLIRGQALRTSDILNGIGNMGKSIVLNFGNTLLVALWSLLLIIPGYIKQLSYSMSFYILADNPDMTSSEAREESIRLMQGNKMRLFKLHLSFIGWGLLSLLTFGILFVWVTPYINVAITHFYEELKINDPRSSADNTVENADTKSE